MPANPSSSWLERIFGKQQEEDDPRIKIAMSKMRQEMPEEMGKANVSSAGPIGRFLMKGAFASTSPWTGNVTLNPDALNDLSQDEINNTLAHELTHTRQVSQMPFYQRLGSVLAGIPENLGISGQPYNLRPREMEAFQTERDRSLRKHLSVPDPQTGSRDIELPNERAIAEYQRKRLMR